MSLTVCARLVLAALCLIAGSAQGFYLVDSFSTTPFPGSVEGSTDPKGLAFINNELVISDDDQRTLYFYDPQTTAIFGGFIGVYPLPGPPVTHNFSATLAPGVVQSFQVTGQVPGTPFIALIDNDLGAPNPDTTLGFFSDLAFSNLMRVNDDGNIFFGDGFASMLSGAVNPDGSISLKVSGYADLDFDGNDDFPPNDPHQEAGLYDLIVDVGIGGNDDPEGLAFDGSDLWIAHDEGEDTVGFGAFLDRIDPFTGELLERFELFHTTGGVVLEAEGLAWDGQHLWISADEQLFEIDPLDGSLLRSFSFAGRNLEGLAWNGVDLLLGDAANLELLFFDILNEAVKRTEGGLPGRPDGLAFDGRDIWFSDATTERVFRIFVPIPGTPVLLLLAIPMLLHRRALWKTLTTPSS